MPEGGRITLRTREYVQKAPEGRRAPGRYVVVTVEDTGTGMAPDVAEHAMEPFFTTKEVGKGSGLGLSQVYGFAAQSGGDVTIDSTVGQGTTISFYLPVRDDAGRLGDGDGGAPVKVLLVEDDADVQAMAIESLRYLGYAVLSANEGRGALDILERDPSIEVLFTDVVMPRGMSGVDLYRAARQLRPGLRVLLASGYARGQLPTIPDDCDFIAKPYRIEELQARLAALVPPRD
jgi:CheY-like chemotaxis protein